MKITLSPTERHLLCGHAPINADTLQRFLDGKPVRDSSKVRIKRAAEELGLCDHFPAGLLGKASP